MNIFSQILTGAILIVIELLRSYPAVVRVKRQHSIEGISPVSIAVLAGTGVGWIYVAILAHSYAAAIATIVWFVFNLALCAAVVRVSPSLTKPILLISGTSLGVSALVSVLGVLIGHEVSVLGVFIAVVTAVYSLPALVVGMRSASVAGLSIISLAINSLEGLIYLWAGTGHGGILPYGHIVYGYIFFGAVAVIGNIPRLARVSVHRVRTNFA